MKVHCGIILLGLLVTAIIATPTCHYRVEENGLYTCSLSEGLILEENGETTIGGTHETGKVNNDVTRVHSEETATDLIMPYIFDNFKNLQILEFTEGIFENISTGHFYNCDKLKKLSVNKGVFKSVPANTFSACAALEEVYLGENAINSLNKDSFSGLPNLQTLTLNDNKLISIPEKVFDGLTNLKILDISSNSNLRDFNNDVFKNNVNLEELVIANNKFGVLKKEFFDGLTRLTKLDATKNEVNATEAAIFDKLTSLKSALFKSNLCIDEDIENFQASDVAKFKTCIDNFNGSTIRTVSKVFLLIALMLLVVI